LLIRVQNKRSIMGISRDKLHKRRATGGRRKILRGKRKFELGRAPALTKLGEKRIHLIRTRGGHHKYRALRLNEGHFVWPGEAATKRSRILNVVYNATSNELVRTNTLVKGCIVQIDATPFKQWYEHFYRVQLGKIKKEEAPGTSAKKDEKPAEGAAPKKDVGKDVKKSAKKDAPKKEAGKEVKKSDKTAAAKKDAPKKDAKPKAATAGKKDENAKAAADAKSAKEAKARKLRRKTADEIKKAIDSGVRKPSHRLKRKTNARNKSRVLEAALKDQFNTGRVLAKISSRPGQSGRCDGYILEGEELNFYLRKIEKKKKD